MLLFHVIVAGVWEYKKRAGQLDVKVEPFRKLGLDERDHVEDEILKLGEFTWTKTSVDFIK